MSKFEIDDRVRIGENNPMFKHLVGREGTVVGITQFVGGTPMIEVTIDRLRSVPVVPFYPDELEKVNGG